nr:ORF I polyprotein [Ipomoea batatas]
MLISHQTLMSNSSHGAMNILKKGEPIGKSDCSDTMEVTCYNHMVQDWPEELNWIFWYLCHEYHILMEFHRPSLRKELDLSVEKDLIKFLTWFYPLKYWKKLCQDGPEFFTFHLHREVTAWVSRFLEGHAEPFMKIYEQHMESIMVREEDYPESQRYIFAQNKVIPKEIWPREGIQPDVRQDDEIYYERIKSARNQYYYELSQAKKGEDIWSQDPWNFDDIDSVLEEVEKIEKAYAQKSRKKRPEDKSQWNKDVWRTKRRQSGMDRQEWVNYMGYPSYSNYSTESDTASDEDSVMDLQFRGEWMIMKAKYAGVTSVHALDPLYKRYQLPTTSVDVTSRRNRGRKGEGAGKLPTPSKARSHIAGNREERSPPMTIDQPRSCIVPEYSATEPRYRLTEEGLPPTSTASCCCMAERRWACRRAVPLPLSLEKETTPRAGEGEPTVANRCYVGGGRRSQGDLTGDSPLSAVETAVEEPLSAHSSSEEGGDAGRKGDWPEVSIVVRWPFTRRRRRCFVAGSWESRFCRRERRGVHRHLLA